MQAAQGMHFLHSSGILHRNLKSRNILLDEKWNAKVSDFGLSKFRDSFETDNAEMMNSLIWTAPEILAEESPFNEAADVYSMGIIMWELLVYETRLVCRRFLISGTFRGKDPYEGLSPATILVSVLRSDLRPQLPVIPPSEYQALMEECWDKDSTVRPTFLEVVNRLKSIPEASKRSIYGSTQASQLTDSIDLSSGSDTSTSYSSETDKGGLIAIDATIQAPVFYFKLNQFCCSC